MEAIGQLGAKYCTSLSWKLLTNSAKYQSVGTPRPKGLADM